ncbi:iron-sulfur cluster assembly accessory protein [Lewinella sp. W8]|uniref:HesB/IscA family protein n=1 Tax=Lewinella sp. W8 TaxID=2528208 RepID=UPI001067320A|nr:iron-sulfur cluster assembly accessory protein [Lewinella sp. W8]MTB50602.1 iron-sulfur cluster assembly accessory protein [Lewinella sp. W8]
MSADVKPTTSTSPIKITDSALEQLSSLRQELGVGDDHFLRVGVRGGGCSGFEYQLGFDLPEDDDQTFMVGDEKVLMKAGHALYLIGMEIDWATGLDNRGFTFNNPNATETCGCGSSFSA